ncbi:hypothetical protein KIM372_02580 [Bombiscardovia nodaiensis]|uniref:Type II toxin-antitoxin system mRNA interferase toxin, RelE/StbE family n=1 Tax=Bombiscardovia nodaiensis TaxID=2932181 RepID=A0ABM8B690_9BIFI|nr:hypothetical protein KIM372_02580 [Bombiscardovia nodaiensis]
MFEIGFSGEYLSDFRRLSRRLPSCAYELMDIIFNELQETGTVSQSYGPHVLVKTGGVYNGCMEFHVRDDVLVLYSPARPKRALTMRRICTHAELTSGRFGREWPTDI